jgi:exodeoxyribonuclease-5
MLTQYIAQIISEHIQFLPTGEQGKLIDILAEFTNNNVGKEILVIRGYAGTGKTTMVSAYIKALSKLNIKVALLAPTGRAAKVLAGYSDTVVTTIHKKIYRQKSSKDAFGQFALDRNLHANTIFIVDEASLISEHQQETSVFGSGNLLNDLISYVYNDKNCKLIMVGDTAQLPPVGFTMSQSMNKSFLETFSLKVVDHELKEVVRQVNESGILFNASALRELIVNEDSSRPKFSINGFTDIKRISGSELLDNISEAYRKYGKEDTIVICRSNKTANSYNQGIRGKILSREEELSSGDMLMVVKNNYHWLEQNEKADFIANGDIIKVKRIRKYEELYGFKFANAEIVLPDYDHMEISVKLLVDTIYSESPALSTDDNKKLFYQVAEDYNDIQSQKKRYDMVKGDPYFNALQVKFAYAVTCHKSQGGQWKAVFIDQGFIRDDLITMEYLKWLYTAITRATEIVYMVNFGGRFFQL